MVAIPDIRDSNPYQAELGAALEEQGVAVSTVDGRGLLLPITRAVVGAGRPSVVHLHFVTPYMAVEDDRLEAVRLAAVCSGSTAAASPWGAG